MVRNVADDVDDTTAHAAIAPFGLIVSTALIASSPWPDATADSGADEGQQVLIDDIGVDGVHAMGIAWIDLELAVGEQLVLEQGGVLVRDDLVIVPCRTRVGTVIAFRSAVWSVSEKALMPSWCAFAAPIIPCRHQFWTTPWEICAPLRL